MCVINQSMCAKYFEKFQNEDYILQLIWNLSKSRMYGHVRDKSDRSVDVIPQSLLFVLVIGQTPWL